jgi:phosphoribosyl isomerase A
MTGFEVIPALDVRAGRLARMTDGEATSLKAVAGDPLELASGFVRAGARWIHFVDLDAVGGGLPGDRDLLARLSDLPVRIQVGGGLSAEGVADALRWGASRAILGASALASGGILAAAVAAHGWRVGVALDVQGDSIAPRGTGEIGPWVGDALRMVAEVAPSFVTYTDLEREGTMAGPNLEAIANVAEATRVSVVASGGIRSCADLRALARLAPRVIGAIVGRAMYEGAFTLDEALAAVD